MSSHPSKDEWRAEQQHWRECRRQTKSQAKSVERKRVGDVALACPKRACNGGRTAATHTARGRVLDEHHERKCERHARERVRAKMAQKQSVERDHAGNGKKVQDVRRRQTQQR